MSRSLRIGLIAEGEAELGPSVPYLKPEEGGKPIEPSQEGALHTLIRRELARINIPDCQFIHRHPSIQEQRKSQIRRGHSILESRYLAQMTIAWQPEEVDLIVIVVDADDVLEARTRDLAKAVATIQHNHIDADDKLVTDRSTGGLAIQNFETWLLADTDTISRLLAIDLETPDDLENRADTKAIMESAIAQSTYMAGQGGNQRPLLVRWDLANHVDLDVMRSRCPEGYGAFSKTLLKTAETAMAIVGKVG
jgi:Domain of unknown function (DUF4276)